MSDLAVPINPGPRTDLEVAARPVSTYRIPTGLVIPDAPTDNSLTQLAKGLQVLNPSLTAVAGEIVTEEQKKEAAAAFALVQQRQMKNVEDLKKAQAAGLIPDGASPNFIRALHTNVLKLSGETAAGSLQDAYFNNDEVRNSDDPTKFDSFVSQWKAARVKADLFDEEGKDKFTPIEVHGSLYHQTIDNTIQSIRNQHVMHRVGEREKLANETAANLIQTRLDAAFDNAINPPDLVQVAHHINDTFFNPVSGQVQYGGLRPSKANEILTAAIVTKAVSAGDASILDVAQHIGPPGGKASLANTATFRAAAETARQHIATSRWMDEERDRKRAEYRGLGIESPDAVEERFREDRARIMETYASEKIHREQYAKQIQKHEAVEPEIKAIIRLHSLNGDTTSKEIRDHLKQIGQVDADAYRSITNWLQTEGRQSRTVDEQTALRTFTRLRASLSDDPHKFDSRVILKEGNAGHLTAGQVDQLYDLVDSSKKQAREFPLMQSPLIQGLRSDLRGAVGQGPFDDFGVGRLRADQAAADLNGLIAGYLRSNPKATEFELYEKIQPMVEKLARKHSQDLNESLTSQENARDPRRQQLEEQLKAKYPNKAQRDQIINQLLRK